MLRRANWWIATDVSEGCPALIFRAKGPRTLFDSEYEGIMLCRNIGELFSRQGLNIYRHWCEKLVWQELHSFYSSVDIIKMYNQGEQTTRRR
jgi:hypothetical protein